MLRRVSAVAVMLVLFGPSFAPRNVDSAANEQVLYSRLTDADLNNTPSWDRNAENPPVSARAAIKLATAVKDSLVKDSPHSKWRFRCLHLEYKDLPAIGRKWYWRIRFEEWIDRELPTPIAPTVEVIVLMSGTTRTTIRPQP
jgi:hypothetical protein